MLVLICITPRRLLAVGVMGISRQLPIDQSIKTMSQHPKSKYVWIFLVPFIFGTVSYLAFLFWLSFYFQLPPNAAGRGGAILIIPGGMGWVGMLFMLFIVFAPKSFFEENAGEQLMVKLGAKTILSARIRALFMVSCVVAGVIWQVRISILGLPPF